MGPAFEETREHLRRIAERSTKNEAICSRMSKLDPSRAREIAAERGMPYQTFINTVVHTYGKNQLYEEDKVLKTLRAMKEAGALKQRSDERWRVTRAPRAVEPLELSGCRVRSARLSFRSR